MTIIYAWPPIRYVSTLWYEDQPVRRSVSALSGARSVATAGPRRRLAQVGISALSSARDGQGYVDSLRRFLGGGINLVKVVSPAANWWPDHNRAQAPGGYATTPLDWTATGYPLDWAIGPDPLLWFTNTPRVGTATTLDGMPAIRVTGLTVGALACRAWDVIRSYGEPGEGQQATARAVRTVFAVASDDPEEGGVAVIPLHDAIPTGLVSLTDVEVAVFEAEIGMTPQPIGQNWMIQIDLREVLEAEIPDDADEVNPWI